MVSEQAAWKDTIMLTLSRRQLQSVTALCSEREHLRVVAAIDQLDTKNIYNVKVCDLRALLFFSVHRTFYFRIWAKPPSK